MTNIRSSPSEYWNFTSLSWISRSDSGSLTKWMGYLSDTSSTKCVSCSSQLCKTLEKATSLWITKDTLPWCWQYLGGSSCVNWLRFSVAPLSESQVLGRDINFRPFKVSRPVFHYLGNLMMCNPQHGPEKHQKHLQTRAFVLLPIVAAYVPRICSFYAGNHCTPSGEDLPVATDEMECICIFKTWFFWVMYHPISIGKLYFGHCNYYTCWKSFT